MYDVNGQEYQKDMGKKCDHFEKELARLRTGRASISILDSVKVDYYGAPTSLNQVASLSTPDARTVLIVPFEKKVLGDIEKSIQIADIGIQPNNDGNVIRLPVPPLNEERRKKIAKSIRQMGEETKIIIRQIRQEYNTKIKKLEKEKQITEDNSNNLQKEVQKATDNFIKKITLRVNDKEQEVLKM